MASISELIKDPKVIKAALTLGAAGVGAAAGVGIHRTMALDPSTTGDVLSGGAGAILAGGLVNHMLNSDNKPATLVYSDTLNLLKKKAPEFDTLLNLDGSEWDKRNLVKLLKDSGKWLQLLQLYRSSGLGLLKDAILDDLGNKADDYSGFMNNLGDPMGIAWWAANEAPWGTIGSGAGISAVMSAPFLKLRAFRKAVREDLINKLNTNAAWRNLYGITDLVKDLIVKGLSKGNRLTHSMFTRGKVRAMLNRMQFELGQAIHGKLWNAILHPMQTMALRTYIKALDALEQSKTKLKTLTRGTPEYIALRKHVLELAARINKINKRRYWTRIRRRTI